MTTEHQYEQGSGEPYSPQEAGPEGAGSSVDPTTASSRPATPLECLQQYTTNVEQQHNDHEPYPQAMRAGDRGDYLLFNVHRLDEVGVVR